MSDNWTDEDWRATLAASEGLREDAEERVRALTAQVVERDAVIEQAPHTFDCNYIDLFQILGCTCWKAQAQRDALAAHDKTVRATALEIARAQLPKEGIWTRKELEVWFTLQVVRAEKGNAPYNQEEGKV